MASVVDFTTVVAIDIKYADQFKATYPTWARHKREILEQPLVVIVDTSVRSDERWYDTLVWLDHPNWRMARWDWKHDFPDVTQRERMLMSFVTLAPWMVATPYWLKIDTDAIASNNAPWILPEWFEEQPAIVASGWGYTKPAFYLDRLETWAETEPDLAKHPALGIVTTPGVECYSHKRIGSWLAFFDTEWTREVSRFVHDRLPVPSEDTYHWYCATRMGRSVQRVNFKALGWQNWHTRGTREAKIAEAMA